MPYRDFTKAELLDVTEKLSYELDRPGERDLLSEIHTSLKNIFAEEERQAERRQAEREAAQTARNDAVHSDLLEDDLDAMVKEGRRFDSKYELVQWMRETASERIVEFEEYARDFLATVDFYAIAAHYEDDLLAQDDDDLDDEDEDDLDDEDDE